MNRNKTYFNNKNATKNPKLFNVSLYRDESGQFHAIGNKTLMLDRSKNREKWVRVNSRDFINALNEQGVIVA
jgi:hypothetical protein